MAWDADASEKVVCRIAAEEGLVARRIGKRICCSSCGGEIAEASLSILANTMLKSAVSELPEGLARSSARVGRVQRRWNGRIGLMGRCGFVRSMSWRSCSLDNAAAGVLRTARGRDVR